MNLVEVEGLRKSFGDKRVLRGFDLSLAAGSVYVLLGRNGAGKSTFVNILLDALEADSGTVKRNFDVKHDVGAVFRRIVSRAACALRVWLRFRLIFSPRSPILIRF